ncbi:hypothetical protein ACWDCL_01810 [Streptomyces sp. NPDC001009]
MSEQTPNEETPAGEPGGEQKPNDEQKPGEQPGAGESKQEDELPAWARKELAEARGQAASYRTRLRDAESRLGQAKTPEEFEAALAEVNAKNAELERSVLVGTVARKYDLPEALAVRLRGATPEELEADAKALQAFATPAAPPNLGGGLNPSDEDEGEMDPRKLARRSRRF